MKLKTSFFNKTIFWKNVTLYWPLWGLYSLILLIIQPVALFFSNVYEAQFDNVPSDEEKLRELINLLYMERSIWIIAIVSLIFGMALFSFLYSSKSANMIHSLPVDRKQLFGTSVISGLTFLIVPQMVTAGLTLIVCLVYAIPQAYYVGLWLLMVAGISVVMFAVVTLCAFFTGLILALPVYVIAANGLSFWVYGLIYYVTTVFAYGVNRTIYEIDGIISLLSPIACLLNNVNIDWFYQDNDMRNQIHVEVNGLGVLAVYVLVAVLLYFLAYRCYKKRQIETAGDLLSVNWLKPVFRWGVGASGGIFGGLLMTEIVRNLGIRCNLLGFLIFMLLLGGLCYFFADMFVKKNFKVFKKENWIGFAKFSVALCITFFAIFGVAKYQEHYVPKEEDIEWVQLTYSYSMEFEGQDVEIVTQIHEKILDKLEVCRENEYTWNSDYKYIRINYSMKNGEYISRRYKLPVGDADTMAILKEVVTLQNSPEIFLTSYLGVGRFKNPVFSHGSVEFYRGNREEEIEWVANDLSEEKAKAMYEAILKDVEEGTLLQYNTFEGSDDGYYYEDYYGYYNNVTPPAMKYQTYIYLSFYQTDENGYGREWKEVYISFGPDCENIINLLIEYDMIESLDDILWE